MKGIILSTILAASILSAPNMSLSNITKALGEGNTIELSSYFGENVEISILNQENTYSKDKASQIIENFFKSYQPRTFSQVHAGVSKNQNTQFCIGNLTTSNGVFRVYIFLKVESDKNVISELKFDKE